MSEYEGMRLDEAAAKLRAEAEGVEVVEIDETASPIEEVREQLGIGESVDPLSALLDAPSEAPTKQVFLKRLNAHFTVEAITDDHVYDQIVERCTRYVKNRRGGGRTREVDGRRLSRLTVAQYCIDPAFTPARDREKFEVLAQKYGTREPEDLVDRALLLGEVDLLADAIMTLSGFDDDLELAGN